MFGRHPSDFNTVAGHFTWHPQYCYNVASWTFPQVELVFSDADLIKFNTAHIECAN